MAPVSDVVVQGLGGGVEQILQELERIADASARKPTIVGISRKFENGNEFEMMLHRLQRGQANVVLRKLFLFNGECNVMQEIWIANPPNPDAQENPLKLYSVVHVHHHAAVSHARDVKPHHLHVVDAMIAQHLAPVEASYQGDNPFFKTGIERNRRNTLKVFPSDADWECGVCRQINFQIKPSCRGRRGAVCSGLRPRVAWSWKQQKSRDAGMAHILQCADAAFQWQSRSKQSQSLPHRATGDSSEEERAFDPGFVLDELEQRFDESHKKVIPAAGAASTRNSADDALWIEPDWSQFKIPANVPSKLTILFVDVDNGSAKDPDLKLKAEYNNILQAYRESPIWHNKTLRVDITRSYFPSWHEVMMQIAKQKPTILHFRCHD